ncbi:hypothetical protein CASFOL_005053 [Castilleja foliolosa]|uniref:Small-subunit processome Utp12 domain-containing protein n=1 Tax=Castilleja foliolosa TaxID=1961234 RepID=A0ABD3E2A7_9LAMI
MGSAHIRDILTAFSPSLDLFAISVGDGRIKIWDTVKGQIQTEFADIASTETGIFGKQEEGHLSMNYTCMKWLSMGKKKKRKLGGLLLVLGTGGGDVLALDVSAGQLKWRVNRLTTIVMQGVLVLFRYLYMVRAFTLLFSAASRALSSLAVSPDGNMIATAAAQLKIFNSSNHKKLQRFSGHPGPVRCMVFSEDGKYVLSSALGERYVAVWKIDGSKEKSSSALLKMDHPAVFLDTWSGNSENSVTAGLSVLAISETGVCYFWHGKTIDELRNSKPTKIYVHCDDGFVQKSKGTIPNVFAAKLQNMTETACGHIFLAHSFIIKPTFEKIAVKSGTDVELSVSQDGVSYPSFNCTKLKRNRMFRVETISSNTDGVLLPMPKMFDLNDVKSETKTLPSKDESGLDTVTLCMEDQLRSLGILAISSTLDSKKFKGINVGASTPHNKIKATVSLMKPSDACTLLRSLVDTWQSRSHSGMYVLPWICCILVHHSDYVKSEDPKLLDYLYKVSKPKGPTVNSLFQLLAICNLFQLRIDKASNIKQHVMQLDEQEEESEDKAVEEVVYGVDDDDYQTGSESDD